MPDNSFDLKTPELPRTSSLMQLLERSIAKIEITDDLSILHPDYPPLTTPPNYHGYLQQMTEAERDRYLCHKLQSYLYGILMERVLPLEASPESVAQKSSSTMVNCGDRWYETEFYRQLVRYNHGSGYGDANWSVVERSQPYWQVSKNGLTLNIDPALHLLESPAAMKQGDLVSIKMPPNSIERGYYIAVGNAGSVSHLPSTAEQTILQLYFNVDAPTALKLLDYLTQRLNERGIAFDLRLPYQEANFPRVDAALLEFSDRDWQQLQSIIKHVYPHISDGFSSKIPFFCRQIMPGIGLAEKPFLKTEKSYSNLGEWYCQLIAQATIQALKDEELEAAERAIIASQKLSSQQIHYAKLYLNPTSQDFYTPIS